MSLPIFDRFLATHEIAAVFDDVAVVQAMLDVEAALAHAQAAHGVIPAAAARTIADACRVDRYDVAAIVAASRRAGSLAIPLIHALTQSVATRDVYASHYVHWGSTSQDVIDTAMVSVTRRALALIDDDLAPLIDRLLVLADLHADTPVLARTLMQPALVTSFGLKCTQWTAPLVRSRARLRELAERALALQLGGAVGTLAVLGDHGRAVSAHMAAQLDLALPDAPWHTQRDEWVRLALEIAVLTGSLGKIATDLSLMAQGEVGELAEPSAPGRGASSAMPHKRNPVAAMTALAASARAPQRAATLLATMGQQHERGLGNWPAELAEWPGLFIGAHSAVQALREAMDGLVVDASRMRRNIDALRGLVFAEAAAMELATTLGKSKAHALLDALARRCADGGPPLDRLVFLAIEDDPTLRGRVDGTRLRAAFDARHAVKVPAAQARARVTNLRAQACAVPAGRWQSAADRSAHVDSVHTP